MMLLEEKKEIYTTSFNMFVQDTMVEIEIVNRQRQPQ